MSSFGWIATGHRFLHSPTWLKRRGVSKAVPRKAIVGVETLESIALLSHASLALARAHLESLHILPTQKKAAAEISKPASSSVIHESATTTSNSTIRAAQTETQSATQTVNVPSTLTNFESPFAPAIKLFDTTLGTLTSVKVTESATLTSNITSQNLSSSSGADITGQLNGNVSIFGLDKPFSGAIQAFSQTISVPANTTNNNNFDPPTTVSFPPLTGSQSHSVTYTQPIDLGAFTATPAHTTITPLLEANAVSLATAPNGNLQTRVQTEGLGTITVAYTYIPANPQIIKVTRYGIHQQPTTLKVSFSGAVSAADASNAANYLIVLPNKFGSFTGAGVTYIPIASATYDAATNSATLVSSRRFNLHYLVELKVTLPGNNGEVLTSVFGGVKDLGGYLNPHNKSEFIPYVPGVTKLPA